LNDPAFGLPSVLARMEQDVMNSYKALNPVIDRKSVIGTALAAEKPDLDIINFERPISNPGEENPSATPPI